MRGITAIASLLSLSCSVAFADDVIIKHDSPPPIIEKRASDVDKKVIIKHDEGCATKTVKKSDGMGDTAVHTKTNC